uniref:Uncharacterized protein n=1 Tax=Parascaris equorum TaxID=6256 RepID=A0A914S6V1_PAREQ
MKARSGNLTVRSKRQFYGCLHCRDKRNLHGDIKMSAL